MMYYYNLNSQMYKYMTRPGRTCSIDQHMEGDIQHPKMQIFESKKSTKSYFMQLHTYYVY